MTCQDGTLGKLGAEIEILLRVLEEVDELDDLELGLLTTGDVLEGHVDVAGVDDLRSLAVIPGPGGAHLCLLNTVEPT